MPRIARMSSLDASAIAGNSPKWRARSSAPLGNGSDDLRNDFAGTFDLHPITRPQVLLANQIEVVERRELHHCAANLHRLENGERIQCSRPADVHLDGQ